MLNTASSEVLTLVDQTKLSFTNAENVIHKYAFNRVSLSRIDVDDILWSFMTGQTDADLLS